MALDPNQYPIYSDLYYAYTKTEQWGKAQAILDKVQKVDAAGAAERATTVEAGLASHSRSKIFVVLLLAMLAGIFFVPLYKASQAGGSSAADSKDLRFSEVVLLSATVSGFFFMVFFALSQWIWSKNPSIPVAEFTPAIRMYIFEHDGVESFALYLIMLLNVGCTMLLSSYLLKLRASKSTYQGAFIAMLLVTAVYFFKTGFFPPIPDMGEAGSMKFVQVCGMLAVLSIGGYLLYPKFSIVVKGVLILFMAFAGLIMVFPSSLPDLSYILYPAMRLMNGFKVSEIYFQYDILLSLLGVLWLKMDYALVLFPYLGQVSYFLFFIASFFLADKFFKTKGLSVMFIVALVVIRNYAVLEQGVSIFQVSPLRLDLWIIPLFIAHKKGVHHWLVGLAIGFLVLLHRNLGLIYLGSYLELMFLLFILDAISAMKDKTGESIGGLIKKHIMLNGVSLLIIVGSIALCFILFHQMFSSSAMIYRTLGIGMLPISNISFYWYVPVILSCIVAFLYHYRQRFGEGYTGTALFVIFLAIGESMYFFGRSHENNMLNIAGILVLAIFILFDMIVFLAPEQVQTTTVVAEPKAQGKGKKQETVAATNGEAKNSFLTPARQYMLLPLAFVLLSGYFYAGRISEKMGAQYGNFVEGQYAAPLLPIPMDTMAIKQVTRNSPKVFILDFNIDFYYYYYGHYVPQGYFNPLQSWVFRKDLRAQLQDLLDKKYYIVYNKTNFSNFADYLPYLRYNQSFQVNDMVAITQADVPRLLPESSPSIYHTTAKTQLASFGIDVAPITVGDAYSIELLVKPNGEQVSNATILNNMSKTEGNRGFTLQRNGEYANKYVFGYGNGLASMPNVVFDMDDNKWHYLVVEVNRSELKLYDNGKLVGAANAGGQPMLNSDIPLTIGNSAERKCPFRGIIREVNISNGNRSEDDIRKNADKVAASPDLQ